RLSELRRDAALRIGELPRLELHFAERAAALVRSRRFKLPLQLAQLVERAAAARGCLLRVLAAQIARSVSHLFGNVAHPFRVVAAALPLTLRLRLLRRLPLLTGLSLLARLALLAGLTLLAARILLSRLTVFRVLLLPRLLPRHLTREILRALTEVGLLARELLDLALQFVLGHLVAVARELLLLLQQLVLPLRELLDLVESTLVRVLALLGARFR